MTHSRKVALGALTHWPIVYMFVFLAFWLSSFFAMQSGSTAMFDMMLVIFPLHALTMLMTMGLWIYYILHTVQNKALTNNERLVWAIVNGMCGMAGWIAYYWMVVYRAPLLTD